MEFIACNTDNYSSGRTQPVRYIVMHYTANNGDTAKNNCDYYHRVGGLQASAHYFVDEHGVMQSVREVTRRGTAVRGHTGIQSVAMPTVSASRCAAASAPTAATTSSRRPWPMLRPWQKTSCSAMA